MFCTDDVAGENVAVGQAFLGMWAAIASGLQYPEAKWWYAREWAPCAELRSKRELDELVAQNPCCALKYSWMHNNCQHFAVHLYEGEQPHAA